MSSTKVKFSTRSNQDFIKELRQKVKDYFESNNISSYGNMNLKIKTVFMFSLYIVPYILMISGVFDSFLAVLLSWFVIGLGKSGVGMSVMHDANHRTYSKNQNVNKWMGKSLYMLGGFPPNWQYQHNTLHHGFTNIDGHDEDIDPGSILRISPHKPRLKIHKFQHIYAWFLYGLMTFSWATTKDFKQLKRYTDNNVKMSNKYSYRKLLAILIFAKIIYYLVFIAIPLLVLPFAWYWIIVFFLVMHFTSGLILTTIFQTAHVVPLTEYPTPAENGSIENSWAVHQLSTTSDFSPNNKVLSWLIGGLNYQVEHHLFPDISHVHYPKIAKIVKTIAEKHHLPYHVQPGFFRAVLSHASMLKSLGRE